MYNSKLLHTRVRLLLTVFMLAALVVISFLSNVNTTAEVGTTTAVVGITKTPTTTPTNSEIDTAVREAIALAGGMPDGIGPSKKIVIQPNLVQAGWSSGSGVVPNAQVMRTVIKMCLELGATWQNITVCEGSASFRGSQGGYTNRQMTQKALYDCGLDPDKDMKVEDSDGTTHIANCVDANNVGSLYPNYPGYSGPYNSSYVTQITKSGFLINRVYCIPNCVAQCDYLIRVPCLKNHNLAGFTGGLKLAFGIAPSDIYHYNSPTEFYKWNLLHQQSWGYNELETNGRGMADVTYCRPPDLVVIDGLVGIKNGPVGDPPSNPSPLMACIIAGKDVVAVDTIACLAVGYKITSIPGIGFANQLDLGTNDPGLIEVRGYHVKDIRRWFPAYACALPGDQTPPILGSVNIADGTHVCGQISVSPTGQSDADPGLCKGELYVNSMLVDSNNISPYNTSWIVSGLSAGAKTLTYTIYDGMLNETSVNRTINIHTGDPILETLGLTNGTYVSLGLLIFTGKASAIDDGTFFVSTTDGIRGLRVRYNGTIPNFTLGKRIAMYGVLATVGGQRYLNCTSYTTYDTVAAVKPRFFSNWALGGAALNINTPSVYDGAGPYNLGCLVKTAGRVSAGGSDYFYISDGSLRDDDTKLKVKCGTFSKPAVGSYVSVVGFSCSEDDGGVIRRMLVARSATEIVPH